ncbi:hypothetical protein BD413DRAFT_161475 [Trametes elegans]|nr:hypothetical protein BD413DRAFT_161475 [Trametes elegans]
MDLRCAFLWLKCCTLPVHVCSTTEKTRDSNHISGRSSACLCVGRDAAVRQPCRRSKEVCTPDHGERGLAQCVRREPAATLAARAPRR